MQKVCNGLFCINALHTVKLARVNHFPGFSERFTHSGGVKRYPFRLDDDIQRQIIFFGKLKIALIMRRHSHNGARSVIHQDKVCQIHRHPDSGHRISAVGTGKNPLFFQIIGGSFDTLCFSDFVDKCGHGLPVFRSGQLKRPWMFWSQRHKGRTKNGVLTCGVNPDRIRTVFNRKINLTSETFSDPVPLHDENALRPTGKRIGIFQKLVGIIGYPEKPLVQFL